jgi:translation initiation factor 3 subunit J
VSNLAPMKKKSTVKQKIKEREERERRQAELGLDSDDDEEDEEEDPLERRKREREAQIKADVENAANLLGTSKISNAASVDASLKPTKLSTKEEWEEFSDNLYKSLIKQHSTKPGYDKYFVPHFTKLLAENLRDVDCRKQSTAWKNIADEKTRAEKEKKSGGGVTKSTKAAKPKTVGTASAKNTIDMRAYGDEALDDGDDLDFM